METEKQKAVKNLFGALKGVKEKFVREKEDRFDKTEALNR